MEKLTDFEKNFLIENKDLILRHNWSSLIKYIYNNPVDAGKLFSLLEEVGVDYLRNPPFKINDKVEVNFNVGEASYGEEDLINIGFNSKWDWYEDNFEIFYRPVEGVVEDILTYEQYPHDDFPFYAVVLITSGKDKGAHLLIGQEMLKDLN